jgi:3-phenylpropionate/trans-cinnamate dioxygenase ferredoxin subunit
MSRHVVATTAEIAPGTCKIVTVKGREIGVFHIGDEFFALFNRCPHQGAPLCTGAIVNRLEAPMPGEYRLAQKSEMIKCPWHCWEYDIRTGQSWCDPDDTKVKSYEVTVEPGAAVAKGPFIAETFAVSVEQDYIVVEV